MDSSTHKENVDSKTTNRRDSTFFDYIDPESLPEEDPSKPHALVLLASSCDKIGHELGIGEFSTILQTTVNISSSSGSSGTSSPDGRLGKWTEAGQKRTRYCPPSRTSCFLGNKPTKMKRLILPPPTLQPPAPQSRHSFSNDEPVNLSTKAQLTSTVEHATPSVNNDLQSQSSLLLTQLLFCGSLLPYLLMKGEGDGRPWSLDPKPLTQPPFSQPNYHSIRNLLFPALMRQVAAADK